MVRALMLTTAFPPQRGGIQTVAYELARRGVADALTVVAPYSPGADVVDVQLECGVHRVRLGRCRMAFLTLDRAISPLAAECLQFIAPAAAVLRREQVDVVHCMHVRVALAALLLKMLWHVPYVVYVYGQEVIRAALPRWKVVDRALRALTLRQAAIVFADSGYTAAKVRELAGARSCVIKYPLGVDVDTFAPVVPTDEAKRRLGLSGQQVILTVGRLIERKGHDIVIRAMARLASEFPAARYVVVGDGPRGPYLRDLVASVALQDRVVFVGEVRKEDLPLYYQAADVFAMISRARERQGDVEGFGLVYLEAGACAKPVVAGRSGGVPDAVVDGVTGLLVSPESVEEVADALARLLRDRELAAKLGQAGRQRVEREMNWENTVRSVRAALCELMRG